VNLPRWMVPWRKATDLNTVTPISSSYRLPSRFGFIVEAFGGAWQSGLTIDSTDDLLKNSAIFACVSLRSGDIAKLRIKVLRKNATAKIWEETESTPFIKVLTKPNRYQTRYQFIQQWIVSKLLWGNTYALKQRDGRGMVEAMYLLDPSRVLPLIAPDGEVYYQIGADRLAGVREGQPAVPASEIIHDRGVCLFHPLIGVSPLYAAAMSGTQGNKIQVNSAKFFGNMSRPSGQLTAPGKINPETAQRLKDEFESRFAGDNIGRMFVAGDGLKFESFTMPADDAQLVEQLKWTGEDVCRAFLVPPYKIGLGSTPSLGHVGALNQEYYQQALQPDMESLEGLLDDGLALPSDIAAEFDTDQLMRMDPKTRAETREIEVRSATLKPNEARQSENRPPVTGGDTVYMQQQNFSLAALAKRDAKDDPFATVPKPAAPAQPDDMPEDEIEESAAYEMRAALAA
jgi:HK97 family phage portal protein